MWSLQFPLYQNLTQFNGSRFSRGSVGFGFFSWRLLVHLLCWLSNPALYMDSVLGGVSIAMINTRTAATWGGKSLFHCTPLRSRSVTQEVRARTEGEAMAECYLLASSHGFLSFSYTTLDHLHRGGTTHNGWDLPHQSFIKETPERLSYMWTLCSDIFSIESPFCQMTRACIKWHNLASTLGQHSNQLSTGEY